LFKTFRIPVSAKVVVSKDAEKARSLLSSRQVRADNVTHLGGIANSNQSRNHKALIQKLLADAGGASPVKVAGVRIARVKAKEEARVARWEYSGMHCGELLHRTCAFCYPPSRESQRIFHSSLQPV
jgi:hypothetical protein